LSIEISPWIVRVLAGTGNGEPDERHAKRIGVKALQRRKSWWNTPIAAEVSTACLADVWKDVDLERVAAMLPVLVLRVALARLSATVEPSLIHPSQIDRQD
jgi:hypothetical protein